MMVVVVVVMMISRMPLQGGRGVRVYSLMDSLAMGY